MQILHGELEASLLAAQGELAGVEVELEKQRALNEKLESDLLQIQAHNPTHRATANGQETPAEDDVLAGLDLGKKLMVGIPHLYDISSLTESAWRNSRLRPGTARYHSHHLQTHRYCLSSQANEIGSDSVMRSWRRYVSDRSSNVKPLIDSCRNCASNLTLFQSCVPR